MEIRTFTDVIIVRPDPKETKTEGGLHIPNVAQEKSNYGEVVQAGPGHWLESGQRAEMQVKVGDRVLYLASAIGVEIEHKGEVLTVMRESDIMGVVE